jgi:hypothetical protein
MSKLQSIDRVREHILQLHSDYRKTQIPIILKLIDEWKQVYINKKTIEDERISRRLSRRLQKNSKK